MMLPYYLLSKPSDPVVEDEQETCENVFSALQELKKLFDPLNQPDIEDHIAVKNLGERIAELALQVHDGFLECLRFERNTYYPRVVLIPTWAKVHDLYCQFAVDWSSKYSIYCQKQIKRNSRTRYAGKEKKLLNGYSRCVVHPDYVYDNMYWDEDIAMICNTVIDSLNAAGGRMSDNKRYAVLSDEYDSSVRIVVDRAVGILAYGIQCFMGMLVRLEKKSEMLWELNKDGTASLLRQYEGYMDKYGEEIFLEMLHSFDPGANENNLPHIKKNTWKRYSEKKLVELLETGIGRQGVKGLNVKDLTFPVKALEEALDVCLCDMDEFYAFLKLFYQYEISQNAYLTIKEWEEKGQDRISALDFYAQIKSKSDKEDLITKKTTKRRNREPKIMPDTYTYRWLATEENRITRLFQTLQNNAGWIAPDESPDNFHALFKGVPKEFYIRWCGTKQHLFHLFKVIFERGLVTWGRKNGQWLILQSHFKNKQGHEFSSFNGEKESIKARATIENLVDILDPTVPKDPE